MLPHATVPFFLISYAGFRPRATRHFCFGKSAQNHFRPCAALRVPGPLPRIMMARELAPLKQPSPKSLIRGRGPAAPNAVSGAHLFNINLQNFQQKNWPQFQPLIRNFYRLIKISNQWLEWGPVLLFRQKCPKPFSPVRGPSGAWSTTPNHDGSGTRSAQTALAEKSDSGQRPSRAQRGFRCTFVQHKSTKLSTKELAPIPTID